MRLSAQTVCEVLQDGEVVLYDDSSFDEEDASDFIDLWGPMENRNFFIATLTLTPTQEI